MSCQPLPAFTIFVGMSRHVFRKLCMCVWLQAKLLEMEARLRIKEAGQSNPPLRPSEGLKHSSTNGSSAARYGAHANRLAHRFVASKCSKTICDRAKQGVDVVATSITYSCLSSLPATCCACQCNHLCGVLTHTRLRGLLSKDGSADTYHQLHGKACVAASHLVDKGRRLDCIQHAADMPSLKG